jgi:hypothetical protein
MKTFRTFASILSALCFFASFGNARADQASGSYTQDFSGLIYLWDVSGTYDESLSDIQVNYTLNMDADGKITGDGTFSFVDGPDNLNGTFTVTGTVKSSGGVGRVTLNLLLNGTGTLSGYPVIATAKASEKLEIDPVGGEMIGTSGGSVKVTIPSLGRSQSVSIPRSVETVDLPPEVDGAWNLVLNPVQVGTSYTGTAQLQLSNGKVFDLNLTGAYSAKKDTSKLSLKGLVKSMSLSLVTSTTGAAMDIQSLKGSALGQKVVP